MISKSRLYMGLAVRDVKIDRSGIVPYPDSKSALITPRAWLRLSTPQV